MAVTDVQETGATGGYDAQGQRQWTVTYRVTTNARTDGPLTVLAHASLPSYFSAYSFGSEQDVGAYRQSLEAEYISEEWTRKLWNVTATFKSRPVSLPDVSQTDDPVDERAEISGDFITRQVPVDVDINDDAVRNSADDRFLGLVKDESYPTLTIAKNYNTIAHADFIEWINTVNNTTFWGLPKRTWKLSRISWKELYRNKYYYRVTFQFDANIDTWDLKPVDQGPEYYLNVGGERGEKASFADDRGKPSADGIKYLDGDKGFALADGADVKIYDGSTPKLQPFQIYEEYNFGLLGIPTSITSV